MKTTSVGRMSICFEPSKTHDISSPEEFLFADEIHMKDGSVWLVTKANSREIELMLKTRKSITQAQIQDFVRDLSFIHRAECFEV